MTPGDSADATLRQSQAHGLISDLLLESATISPRVVSVLRAVAGLLSPPLPGPYYHHYPHPHPHHGSNRIQRQHVVPAHAALSDVHYSSDTDDIPYTGEPLPVSKVRRFPNFPKIFAIVTYSIWSLSEWLHQQRQTRRTK